MIENSCHAIKDLTSGTRVVVAMSGGVDSSAVAALAVDAGLEVLGVTLQLYDHGTMIGKKGACCAGRDIHDARRVCDALGIPHYVLDYESVFRREVIDDFMDSYTRGETPIPCVRCNQKVKFRDLLQTARDLGAEALLTGHYVQRTLGPSGPEMHKAVDAQRDQSYFLFATTFEQLSFCRFPLGGVPNKAFTRGVAEARGLPVARKPDSQDICFVVNGSYQETLRKLRPESSHHGQIVHVDGPILGRHEGIEKYTVGQRKGLGVAWHEPLYVVALDPTHHRVLVGPRAALACREIHLKDVTWVVPPLASSQPWDVTVKVRSTHHDVPAQVWVQGTQAVIRLSEPEYGVAPGQACVLYRGTQVLGGGWIVRTSPEVLF